MVESQEVYPLVGSRLQGLKAYATCLGTFAYLFKILIELLNLSKRHIDLLPFKKDF